MPMFETEIPCPICQNPLTDVDGMLECQYPTNTWHFIYLPEGNQSRFNFEAWAIGRTKLEVNIDQKDLLRYLITLRKECDDIVYAQQKAKHYRIAIDALISKLKEFEAQNE